MTTTAFVDTSATNLVSSGIMLDASFSSTDTLQSKVLDNTTLREKSTLLCDSSQNGTWVIFDVNEKGGIIQIISIPVTGGTFSVYTYNHIARRIYMTFTPAASPGTVMLRGYTGGFGIRST